MWSFKICTILSVYSWGRRHANQWQFQMSGCCTYQYLYIDYGAKCASWRPGRVSTGHIHSSIHSLTPAGDLGDMSFSIAVFFISFQLCWYPKRKKIPSWKHFPLNVSNFKTTENVKIHSLIQSKQVLKSWEVTGMRGWRMMGLSWHGSTVNISTGTRLKGHPSFCGDRKTNRLTLSGDWLSYIYLIIIELLRTGTPSTHVTLPAFSLSHGAQDQTQRH